MPLKATIKAYFHPTLTLNLPIFTLLYIVIAVRSGAPLKLRVKVNINVLLELQILRVYLLRSKLPNLIPRELLRTRPIGTLDDSHLPIGNVKLQVVIQTVKAKLMITLDPVHVLLQVVHVAYFTHHSTLIDRIHFRLHDLGCLILYL